MSEVRQIGRPFAPGSAPTAGRMKGSKNKLNARSLKVIDTLLADFAQHGAEAVKIVRVERPNEYGECVADIASRLAAAEHGGDPLVGANGRSGPTILVVRWGGDQQQQLNNDNVIPLLETEGACKRSRRSLSYFRVTGRKLQSPDRDAANDGGLMARQFVTWHTSQTPHGPCSWAVVDGLLHVRSALGTKIDLIVTGGDAQSSRPSA